MIRERLADHSKLEGKLHDCPKAARLLTSMAIRAKVMLSFFINLISETFRDILSREYLFLISRYYRRLVVLVYDL